MKRFKISRFWFYYFIIRLFYFLFANFVYVRVANVFDMYAYLNGSVLLSYSASFYALFTGSTYFTGFLGNSMYRILGNNVILTNSLMMLISFFTIKWTVDKLSLRKHVNNVLLMVMISLPHLCILTSYWSKETFGLVFSGIIAVLIIKFLNGNYKLKLLDIIGLYLCFLFKIQYIPFILQGLLYIYITKKVLKNKPGSQIMLAIIFLCINVLFLYIVRDLVNSYASRMYIYFPTEGGRSTRDNIILVENDFFRYIPYGMFIAFFGPTLEEMIRNPFWAAAGIESLFIIISFLYLSKSFHINFLLRLRIRPGLTISYLIIFFGICFIHYPFGILNMGSAIRYRNNFLFLFIILLLYLYSQEKEQSYKELMIQK